MKKDEVIKIMLGWIENNEPIETTADKILDLLKSEYVEIRDEMDGDMEDSGMSQGEIESCLNHWSNKYVIHRK